MRENRIFYPGGGAKNNFPKTYPVELLKPINQLPMKKLILAPLLLCLVLTTSAQHSRHNIIFDLGQTELDFSLENEIKKLLQPLNEGQYMTLFPLTFDSLHNRLTYAKNAKSQAEAIREFIKSMQFEVTDLVSNFPSAYRGMSVSITVTLHIPGLDPPTTLASHYPEKPSQFFVIDPDKDTIIVGEEGTTLYFKAGVLLCQNKVEVELKEYYGLDDYLKSGLQTASNGQMIETGGTIYLDAVDEISKKKVSINQGEGIGIDFTIGKDNPEMQIFVKDPRSSGSINWILPPKPTYTKRFRVTFSSYDVQSGKRITKVFNSEKEWDEFKRQLELEAEKKRKEYEVKVATRKSMEGKLSVLELGFINCDRFYNEPMQPLQLTADPENPAEYYLIFKDVRGVMKGRISDGKVQFGSVPRFKQCTLIAVSISEDSTYFYKDSFEIGAEKPKAVQLTLTDEAYVNQQLALLK